MKYCQKVTELTSQAQERELSIWEQSAVKMHLMLCPKCRNFQKNCESLSNMMKQFAQPQNADKK